MITHSHTHTLLLTCYEYAIAAFFRIFPPHIWCLYGPHIVKNTT